MKNKSSHMLVQTFRRTYAFNSNVIHHRLYLFYYLLCQINNGILWIQFAWNSSCSFSFCYVFTSALHTWISMIVLYWLPKYLIREIRVRTILASPLYHYLYFLLILKDSIISPARLSIYPLAHTGFPTIWATIVCDFLIYSFNNNVPYWLILSCLRYICPIPPSGFYGSGKILFSFHWFGLLFSIKYTAEHRKDFQ